MIFSNIDTFNELKGNRVFSKHKSKVIKDIPVSFANEVYESYRQEVGFYIECPKFHNDIHLVIHESHFVLLLPMMYQDEYILGKVVGIIKHRESC